MLLDAIDACTPTASAPGLGAGGAASRSRQGWTRRRRRRLKINLTGGPRPAATPASITSITSDEPIEVGAGGDGHTTDYDVAIIDDTTFDLRSERQGGGDGRVYRVHFLDTDGNAGSCEFLVPHNRGPVSGATDSGTFVTVTP